LLGALATIVCDVDSVHQAGDHKIVLGRALHLEQQEAGAEPLIFFRGSYARLHIEEDASG
jgi:flavin reductase (DIM6/NTAB) family NADH-FMN oxidoreductase RutF